MKLAEILDAGLGVDLKLVLRSNSSGTISLTLVDDKGTIDTIDLSVDSAESLARNLQAWATKERKRKNL